MQEADRDAVPVPVGAGRQHRAAAVLPHAAHHRRRLCTTRVHRRDGDLHRRTHARHAQRGRPRH